LYKKYTG
jgi:hypothetical protein